MSLAFPTQYVIEAPLGTIAAADQAVPSGQTWAVANARKLAIKRATRADRKTFGFNLVLLAMDTALGAGAEITTVTFDTVTVWCRDNANSDPVVASGNRWYRLRPETALPSGQLIATADVRDPDICVQVVGLSGVNAANVRSIICRATEI